MTSYKNPIIKGFNPDPSICRVGEDYYLVTSTFEFSPGVPIYHSKNLVDWELINYCLMEEDQLPLNGQASSKGIYAPTIRFHKGIFYMTTTNISGGGNFYVTTDNIYGSWSKPIWVNMKGIDPTIFFDEDGKVYFMTNLGAGIEGVGLAEMDIRTGELLEKPKWISNGDGGSYVEAPHIYKLNGYYYLLVAEGGTQEGHMVTLHRAKSIYGPYESCPYNPILSHRDRARVRIKGTGHGDFVWDREGKCFMVCLAYRTIRSKHLHNLGRETFLAPVTWKDAWPIVGNNGFIEEEMEADLPGVLGKIQQSKDFIERFDNKKVSLHWNYIRNRKPENYLLNDGSVLLKSNGFTMSEARQSPCFMGIRQKDFETEFSARIDCNSSFYGGISAYLNDQHHYDFFIEKSNKKNRIGLRKRIFDNEFEVATAEIEDCKNIKLMIKSDEDMYYFYYQKEGQELIKIGQGSTTALCTEVTTTTTFTGTYLGIFCEEGSMEVHEVKCLKYC